MFRSKRISAVAAVVAGVVTSAVVISSATSASSHSGSGHSAHSSKAIEVTTHKSTRYEIDTKQDYDTFVSAFEKAVPFYTPAANAAIFKGVSSWDEIVSNTAAFTDDFLLYAKTPGVWTREDDQPFTGWPWAEISGNVGLDDRRSSHYLMGNHVIAEMMYRYNPAIMLHAPLRVLIIENAQGDAVFTIMRPSDLFGAYGDKRIAKVGLLLNRKVAGLLRDLGAPVPAGLAR